MSRSPPPRLPAEPSTAQSGRSTWLWGALLVLLVGLVYWPTLSNGFISDDWYYVRDNSALKSDQGLWDLWFKLGTIEQYYPVVHSTFWAEYRLWGLDPRGFHAVNVAFHAITVLLVWRLLVRLAVPGAWLAAAIFAVHPTEVESVAWISERKNILSCLFGVAAILAYLRFDPLAGTPTEKSSTQAVRSRWLWYVLALTSYVLAVLSKSVVASVPAVILVIYWWQRGRVTTRDVLRLAPFFAVGLALGCLTIWMERTYVGAQGQEWDLSAVDRLLVAGRALWFYPAKLIWPTPLIFFYPRWVIDPLIAWQYLFPLAAIALVVGLWTLRQHIGRGPLAAVLIFGGVLVPALGFFNVYPFRYSFVADHYQYHAGIALIALACSAIALIGARLAPGARRIATVGVALVIIAFGTVAHRETADYRDDLALDEDIIAVNPQSWIAHYNLGIGYRNEEDFDRSAKHWQTAIDIRQADLLAQPGMLAFQDELAACYVNLAYVQNKAGNSVAALESHRRALEIREQLVRDNPDVAKYQNAVAASHMDVGLIDRDLARPTDAEQSFLKAIEIREQLRRETPPVPEYLANLAGSYATLATLQQAEQRIDDAITAHQKALEIRAQLARENPHDQAYRDLVATSEVDIGLLLMDVNRIDEAERAFQSALKIREKLVHDDPRSAVYRDGLGWCYADLAIVEQRRGRNAEAGVLLRRAIEIRKKLVADAPTADRQNDLAACFVDLGILERNANRHAEAIALSRQAIELREKLVEDDPDAANYRAALAWANANLGVAQLIAGAPAEAVKACQRAVELREDLVRDRPYNVENQVGLGWGYANLGAAQIANGQAAAAEASHRKAIRIRVRLLQESPTKDDFKHEIALSLHDLGTTQVALNKHDKAAIFFRAAVKIRERLALDNPNNAVMQANLASDQMLLGDALAMQGEWREGAEAFAQSARASNLAWQPLWRYALAQLAADDLTAYRAACAEIVARFGKILTGDELLATGFLLVAGENALANMRDVAALIDRATQGNPADPLASTVAAAAQFRAGNPESAHAQLEGTMEKLRTKPANPDRSDVHRAAELLGELLLARAVAPPTDAQTAHLQSLRDLIKKPIAAFATTAPGVFPAWTGNAMATIADREVAKLTPVAGQPESTPK